MVKHLAMVQTSQLNLFPAKGGVSKYYSPRAIMTQQVIDYNKHCKIPFGSFVQASHETDRTNTNVARMIDCIYLWPNNSIQGGHEVMDLTTGRVITRNRVTVIPLSNVIIQAVERMAEDQGMKDLRFKNRHGQIYNDIDIAGVPDNHPDHDDLEEQEDETFQDNEVDGDNEDDTVFFDEDIDQDEVQDLQDENENANPGNPNPPDPDDRSVVDVSGAR